MLSKKTIEFLNAFCDDCDERYQEGGAVYSYTFGRNLAHTLKDLDTRKPFRKSELYEEEACQIREFFDQARGNWVNPGNSPEAIGFLESLVSSLSSDLQYDSIDIVEFGSDEYHATFKVIMIKRNDYSSLDMFWSLD